MNSISEGKFDRIQKPKEVVAILSVSQYADEALESASKAHTWAQNLIDELRQRDSSELSNPMRSGIDGKLQDAADHSSSTLSALQELRAYLLG